MTQAFPTAVTFAGGEGQQDSASMYLHGSVDGGEDTYTVGGAPAVWVDDDGGIGVISGDTHVSFAGHENDDAGTGGPYSSRIGALLLREQVMPSPDYEVVLGFQFQGTAKGEKVFVGARLVPTGLTGWKTRGLDGLESPHYFTSCTAGVGLELDDGGNAELFFYASDGSRTSLATGTVTVGAGSHTLSLLVTGKPGGTVTPKFDGSTPFAASSYALSDGDAPSRGHAAFGLTRTQATDYPLAESFTVKDHKIPASPVTVLLDEWERTPELEGTIVPTGAVPDTIDLCPHRQFEWGGNKIGQITAREIGPWLTQGARRYGPDSAAAAITSSVQREYLDLWMRGADAADQVAEVVFDWTMATTGTLSANLAVGVAARGSKSAEDASSTPTLAAATAYIFRAVFASPSPYFELVRVVAGVETRLEQTRPFSVGSFQKDDQHTLRLQVEDSGGDPVLDATWIAPDGAVVHVFDSIADSDASKITAAGSPGIYCKVGGMGGLNPAWQFYSLSMPPLTISPPTFGTEAESAGDVPFAPEFAEAAQLEYRTQQTVTDRLYVTSRREFIAPRTTYSATWVLQDADAATLYDFLVARQEDRKSFTVEIDGTDREFLLVEPSFEVTRTADGVQQIGPVDILEVL